MSAILSKKNGTSKRSAVWPLASGGLGSGSRSACRVMSTVVGIPRVWLLELQGFSQISALRACTGQMKTP